MVSSWSSWRLLIFFLTSKCQAYIWCASGYVGSNIYLSGKNTYFESYDSVGGYEYYYSSAVPFQSDRTVFIWKNITDKCYTFLTLPLGGKGANIPQSQMVIHAICTLCNDDISNPSLCPLWNIVNEGIDSSFNVTMGYQCKADNWIINDTLHSPQMQPPDICMHNTDEYRADLNDLNFVLFSVDRNGNPYYYDKMKIQYITQYFSDLWYWIQYDTLPSSHKESIAYCMISQYPDESIIDCSPWYYQNPLNTSQYLLYNLKIDDHDCNFANDNICVYDSTLPYDTFNKDINGDYKIYTDALSYDGFSGGSRGVSYIRYIDNTWRIGYNQDLDEYIYSICNNNNSNPFDITSCNGYWQPYTLTISNTYCVNRPTSSPTLHPTIAPSISPTVPPSIAPSYSPTKVPSKTPTSPPTNNPTYTPTPNTPTLTPSNTPITSPTQTQTQTLTEIANKRGKMSQWQQLKSSGNFTLVKVGLVAIVFLCCAIAFSTFFCMKRRKRKKKDKKRQELQKERDTFREQITLDVTEHFTDAIDKVSTQVTQTVAKTTKEVLLESIHGSIYMGSPSPTKHTVHNNRRFHSYPIQHHHEEDVDNNMRHLSANYQYHHHLSPNIPSSTVPLSSPAPKSSVDGPSEVIYDVPNSITYNKSSPYDRSNAVMSPNRHNSYRDSADSSNKHHMFYEDNIQHIAPPNDSASVNYDDHEIEEKINRLSYNRHKKRIHKQYGITQPDVFPDDGDDEGCLETQSVAYNNVAYIHYNSDSEQDKEEKEVQNDATMRSEIAEIELISKHKEKPSQISMNTEEYVKIMEKVMLDKSSSFNDDIEEERNDVLGPLNKASHLSPIVVIKSKRKSQSEMSASHQTGKSFMTLVNEQKQIEISQDNEDDGLDDDDDDLDDENEEQIESSPLLSHNEEEEDVDVDYEEQIQMQRRHKYNRYNNNNDSISSIITDETEEYDALSKQYPLPSAQIGNRKSAHNVVPSESQASFDMNYGIENPFKIVDPDDDSYTTTAADDLIKISQV